MCRTTHSETHDNRLRSHGPPESSGIACSPISEFGKAGGANGSFRAWCSGPGEELAHVVPGDVAIEEKRVDVIPE